MRKHRSIVLEDSTCVSQKNDANITCKHKTGLLDAVCRSELNREKEEPSPAL